MRVGWPTPVVDEAGPLVRVPLFASGSFVSACVVKQQATQINHTERLPGLLFFIGNSQLRNGIRDCLRFCHQVVSCCQSFGPDNTHSYKASIPSKTTVQVARQVPATDRAVYSRTGIFVVFKVHLRIQQIAASVIAKKIDRDAVWKIRALSGCRMLENMNQAQRSFFRKFYP